MSRKDRKKEKTGNKARRVKRDRCNGKGREHNPTPKQARAGITQGGELYRADMIRSP